MRCCAGRPGDYKSPESSLGSRVDIGDAQREEFRSIEIGGLGLSPHPSQEPMVPKEERHSFMDRMLRGGSGCLRAESMVSTQVPHHTLRPPFCKSQHHPSCDIQLQRLNETHGRDVARAAPW